MIDYLDGWKKRGQIEWKFSKFTIIKDLTFIFCDVDSSAGHGANKLTAAALMRHDAVLGDTDDAHPVSMDRDGCCQLTRNEGRKHRLNMELDLKLYLGSHVHSCTHNPQPLPPPPAFELIYVGAIGQLR